MAGIYLHIPFCKNRCIYCDFYSTTSLEKLKTRYINALCNELIERVGYLHEPVHTIYLGGGTPSQLNVNDLKQILQTIDKYYGLTDTKEITLEANPDDLTPDYIQSLCSLPVNRISMGIQTFNDPKLIFLKRRHNADCAIRAFHNCRKAGFNNISIDLIYGLPGETKEEWYTDLQTALSLHPEHISAYSLTYEKGTRIYNLLQEHKIKEINEEDSLTFYSMLVSELKEAGYLHYEISNFCLPEYNSKHNSSYWEDIPYLGCGASAHSYNGTSRQWNVADIHQYIESIEQGKRKYEEEKLEPCTRYNERVITSLRTSKGIDLKKLRNDFGETSYQYLLRMAESHIQNAKLTINENRLRLTNNGVFTSDDIISDLLQIN